MTSRYHSLRYLLKSSKGIREAKGGVSFAIEKHPGTDLVKDERIALVRNIFLSTTQPVFQTLPKRFHQI